MIRERELKLSAIEYRELENLINGVRSAKKHFTPMESVGDCLAVRGAYEDLAKFVLEKAKIKYNDISSNAFLYENPLRIDVGYTTSPAYPKQVFYLRVHPVRRMELYQVIEIHDPYPGDLYSPWEERVLKTFADEEKAEHYKDALVSEKGTKNDEYSVYKYRVKKLETDD